MTAEDSNLNSVEFVALVTAEFLHNNRPGSGECIDQCRSI